jgi:hypothetical protein
MLNNTVALVRERTIPTERLPPVSEVSANFCWKTVGSISCVCWGWVGLMDVCLEFCSSLKYFEICFYLILRDHLRQISRYFFLIDKKMALFCQRGNLSLIEICERGTEMITGIKRLCNRHLH